MGAIFVAAAGLCELGPAHSCPRLGSLVPEMAHTADLGQNFRSVELADPWLGHILAAGSGVRLVQLRVVVPSHTVAVVAAARRWPVGWLD